VAGRARLRQTEQRHRLHGPLVSPINCTKVSIELPAAVSALATDSVEGQRSRPSGVTRLDLLKLVDRGRIFSPAPKPTARRGRPDDRARSRPDHGSACAALLAVSPWLGSIWLGLIAI